MTYDPKVLNATQEDRAAAFEWLRTYAMAGCQGWRHAAIALEEWSRLLKPASEIPDAGWRDGEPPKDGLAYLAFFPWRSGYVADQRFNIVHWTGWGGGVWDNVSGQHMSSTPTHWRPLPEAPKW